MCEEDVILKLMSASPELCSARRVLRGIRGSWEAAGGREITALLLSRIS